MTQWSERPGRPVDLVPLAHAVLGEYRRAHPAAAPRRVGHEHEDLVGEQPVPLWRRESFSAHRLVASPQPPRNRGWRWWAWQVSYGSASSAKHGLGRASTAGAEHFQRKSGSAR